MRPYEDDYLVRLRFARERAADLREDWGMANYSKGCRVTSVVAQCRTDVIELIDRASIRMSGFRVRRELVLRDFSG